MPRAFSSGALSIWSKATNCTFGLFFAKTFVMAAVKVVFPWSTCPIVPMFTCGLLRSNFSLLMVVSRPHKKRRHKCRLKLKLFTCHALNFRDHFLGDVLGRLVITLKMHCRSCA